MTSDPDIAYHLKELIIASTPSSTHYAMPEFVETDQTVLDIGCGIGQIFVASKKIHGKLLVGLDINPKCLSYGHRQFNYIDYVNGVAECLPFPEGLFDLVISRVSLPYTNILKSLAEANRVLKPNGKVWYTLHPISMTIKHLIRSIRTLNFKDIIFRSYVLVNGLTFNCFGKLFPFIINNKYESFQTIQGMKSAMENANFKDIFVGISDGHFVCTGRKSSVSI